MELNLADFLESPNRQNKFHTNFSSYTVYTLGNVHVGYEIYYFTLTAHKLCMLNIKTAHFTGETLRLLQLPGHKSTASNGEKTVVVYRITA